MRASSLHLCSSRLAFADGIDLARAADAVLLVHTTTPSMLRSARRPPGSSRILGFVLNAVKDAPRNSSYYYDYGRKEDGRE